MRVLNVVTFTVALLLIVVQGAFAVRGIVAPSAGAVGFGLPADGPVAEFYHSVYRDRNLVLTVIAFGLLVSRSWRALAIVFVASTTLPLYDIVALRLAGIPVLPLHYITLVALVIVSGLVIACAMKEPSGR